MLFSVIEIIDNNAIYGNDSELSSVDDIALKSITILTSMTRLHNW